MNSATAQHTEDAALELDGLEGKVGYLLRRAQIAVFAGFIDALRELQLRPGQFTVLRLVGGNPGVTQSRVCAALGIKRANLVAVIDELEARRFLTRVTSDLDRRSNCLRLTVEGHRLLSRAIALEKNYESTLAAKLGPGGSDKLLGLLARLAS